MCVKVQKYTGKQKKNRLDIIQTARFFYSGIGIRTPTYRVRVCYICITKQRKYRYKMDVTPYIVKIKCGVTISSIERKLFLNLLETSLEKTATTITVIFIKNIA